MWLSLGNNPFRDRREVWGVSHAGVGFRRMRGGTQAHISGITLIWRSGRFNVRWPRFNRGEPTEQKAERPQDDKPTAALEPEEPEEPQVLMGTIRAVLRPRGLVEVAKIIESAWWESDEQTPARDALVRVERAPGGHGWIARPLEITPVDGDAPEASLEARQP
jgi:hypothetical protein